MFIILADFDFRWGGEGGMCEGGVTQFVHDRVVVCGSEGESKRRRVRAKYST